MKLGKFAIGIALLLSAPGARADAAEPNSGAHLITTPAETKAPAAETGLHFSVENRGLHSLSYNGRSLPRNDEPYRRAMLAADLAIADNGLMVLMWRLLRGKKIQRVSGLKYLKRLLAKLKGEGMREIIWVLPTERARQRLLDWSRREAFAVNIDDCQVAPQYGLEIEDRHLLALVEERHPAHVVIAIGSGPQEKLGYYLRQNLSYRPAIHCIGAALGFITGDKVTIPDWADRFYLGWLLRLVRQPRVFAKRFLRAFELPWLIWKNGENLPPMRQSID